MQNLLWRGAGFYGQEAIVAYNNFDNPDGAGSGGIGMWVIPRLLHLISDTEQMRSGFASWVRFHGVPGQDVTVLTYTCLIRRQKDVTYGLR